MTDETVDGIHDVTKSDVLAAREQLLAQRNEGFSAPMDTLKDKQWLEGLHESGHAPWELWAGDREAHRDLAVAFA